jgi:transposase
LEESIEPRIKEARTGERILLFADAAHFVCGSFLGYLWCIIRIFVPTMSGRKRYNVLGAINAITHDLHTVCNETYINALSVCELLDQISQIYVGRNITVILDNAKYQRCYLVGQHAEKLNIELLFLPSYSPNLNIIERLWKWTKKECLNCKYYDTFDKFKTAIDNALFKIKKHENKQELETLLALNFQLYDNVVYDRV